MNAKFKIVISIAAIIISVMILNESMCPVQIVGGLMILEFTLFNELGAITNDRLKNVNR